MFPFWITLNQRQNVYVCAPMNILSNNFEEIREEVVVNGLSIIVAGMNSAWYDTITTH